MTFWEKLKKQSTIEHNVEINLCLKWLKKGCRVSHRIRATAVGLTGLPSSLSLLPDSKAPPQLCQSLPPAGLRVGAVGVMSTLFLRKWNIYGTKRALDTIWSIYSVFLQHWNSKLTSSLVFVVLKTFGSQIKGWIWDKSSKWHLKREDLTELLLRTCTACKQSGMNELINLLIVLLLAKNRLLTEEK